MCKVRKSSSQRTITHLLMGATFLGPVLSPVMVAAAADLSAVDQTRKKPAAKAKPAYYGAPHEEEQLIVTGTRDPHQTASRSLSPIAVFSSKQMQQTGQVDLREAMMLLAPSITRPAVSNGNANLTDGIEMRGLTPNQTLVLVNGKRRHTTSILNDVAGTQQGSVPVDLDMIPISAIDHIEVLQDGAAAQYGSDAIAGVVNIILKHSPKEVMIQSINGGHYAGDGFTTGEAVNWGTNLGDHGFFDLSAEAKYQGHTDRGGIDNRTGVQDNHILGDPSQNRETISYNMGYNIDDHVQFYSFASYGHAYGQTYQNYRLPSILPQVYPNGFSPKMTLDQNDYSFTAGFKGKHFGWDWDVSTTYGGNTSNSGLIDSGNPDLYNATGQTPTDFVLARFNDSEWVTDANIRRAFNVPVLAAPLNFTLGAQYRYDTYQVMAGDAASYYGGGSQASVGLSPASASRNFRDVTAGYVDVSTELLKGWHIDLAGRVEHYTDVGNTETGKAAMRYDFSRKVGIRGTISNGFRAPSLAEEHFSSLSVSPDTASGILPVNSLAARELGSRPLTPEKSTNYSAGIVLNPIDRLHIAIDAYQINLKNRITLGGVYSGQTAEDALNAGGFGLPSGLDPNGIDAQYFANTSNTRTRGMDITANYLTHFGKYGDVTWDLSINLNKTVFTKIGTDQNGNSLLNALYRGYMTTYTPRDKEILGFTWTKKKWSVSVHEIRYGSVESQQQYVTGPNAFSNMIFLPFKNAAKEQTNLLVAYQMTPALRLSLGANNIFNAKQSIVPYNTAYLGVQRYNMDVQQIGFDGGYYYFQVNYLLH